MCCVCGRVGQQAGAQEASAQTPRRPARGVHARAQARDKQMARLGREEALASCAVQLANGRRMSLGSLRGYARVVVCAGTNAQVRRGAAGRVAC